MITKIDKIKNDKFKNIIMNLFKAKEDLDKCEKENCKNLYKVKEERIVKIMELNKKYIDDLNKNPKKHEQLLNEYKNKINKITNDKKYIKGMNELNTCAIENCKDNITSLLENMKELLTEICKEKNLDETDKILCKYISLLNKLIIKNKKNKLTANDIHEMGVKVLREIQRTKKI